jgi:hypothetical protein
MDYDVYVWMLMLCRVYRHNTYFNEFHLIIMYFSLFLFYDTLYLYPSTYAHVDNMMHREIYNMLDLPRGIMCNSCLMSHCKWSFFSYMRIYNVNDKNLSCYHIMHVPISFFSLSLPSEFYFSSSSPPYVFFLFLKIIFLCLCLFILIILMFP